MNIIKIAIFINDGYPPPYLIAKTPASHIQNYLLFKLPLRPGCLWCEEESGATAKPRPSHPAQYSRGYIR